MADCYKLAALKLYYWLIYPDWFCPETLDQGARLSSHASNIRWIWARKWSSPPPSPRLIGWLFATVSVLTSVSVRSTTGEWGAISWQVSSIYITKWETENSLSLKFYKTFHSFFSSQAIYNQLNLCVKWNYCNCDAIHNMPKTVVYNQYLDHNF